MKGKDVDSTIEKLLQEGVLKRTGESDDPFITFSAEFEEIWRKHISYFVFDKDPDPYIGALLVSYLEFTKPKQRTKKELNHIVQVLGVIVRHNLGVLGKKKNASS